MLLLGLMGGLVQLALGGLLILALAAGILQDADQWSIYSQRVVTQISLITIGGGAGVLASTLALFQRRSRSSSTPSTPAIGLLVAIVVTVVSVPLGWDYWLEFGSNVGFFVVVISSGIYVVIYLTMAASLPWGRKQSRLRR